MSKKIKTVRVTRKFLLNLANDIYNPKTKKFLRLCDGVLQNGPDPEDAKRPMHCGLGELYFAMTGLQPDGAGVNEDDVIKLALKQSPLYNEEAALLLKVREAILDVDPMDVTEILNAVAALHSNKKVVKFTQILESIPDVNDGCGSQCDNGTFRNRSLRVAKLLRTAAQVLPV